MKPITVDNHDGRTLLALRAGPMTPSEVSRRVGQSVPGWLLKAGYVTQDDSYYRITEAGRAACPHRNPLAAPGVVQPAIYIPETDMSRSNCITRQQVLAAITEAGVAGTTPKALIERFDCADQVIYNHVLALTKQNPPAIFKPEKGRLVAIHFNGQVPPRKVALSAAGKSMHATREAVLAFMEGKPQMTPATIADGIGCHEDSTRAVLAGLYAGLKVDRAHDADLDDYRYFIGVPVMETQATQAACDEQSAESETQSDSSLTDEPQAAVEIAAEALSQQEEAQLASDRKLENRTAPRDEKPSAIHDLGEVVFTDPEAIDFGIWSNGALTLDDGEITVQLSGKVTKKLRAFLGLFSTEAA